MYCSKSVIVISISKKIAASRKIFSGVPIVERIYQFNPVNAQNKIGRRTFERLEIFSGKVSSSLVRYSLSIHHEPTKVITAATPTLKKISASMIGHSI